MTFRITPLLTAVAAAAAFATGCPPEEDPPPPPPPPQADCVVDTNFPNQDAVSAVDLAPDTPTTGTLCPARDDDGYRVAATAGDVLVVTLSMTTNITNVEPSFGLFLDNGDGSMTSLGVFSSDPDQTQGHATNFSSAHRVDVDGDYIVDVRDLEGLDNGFDNLNEYTVTVSVVADPDANEPNNVPADATALTSGTPTDGVIATSGDDDWYSIPVTGTAQIIDVTITVPKGSGVEHQATLFAPDALTVLQSTAFTVDAVDATKESVRIRKGASESATGPFLLLVEDSGDDGDQDAQLDPLLGKYTIALTLLADPDVNEAATGNDTIALATNGVPTNGTPVAASLATLADQDVYRITPPGGTSANAPKVLVVTVAFDGALSTDFKPQVKLVTADPEDLPPAPCANVANLCEGVQPGTDRVLACYDNKCGTEMLQRFIQISPFQTAFPLRNTEPVFIEINEFNDDAFQDGGGYTISFEIQNDPDAGEKGDDFLIPNLEFAGFANGGELSRQRDESKQRARQFDLGFGALCPNDEVTATNDGPGGCIDLVAPSFPVGFEFDALIADCTDSAAASVSRTFGGAITYEGDRDYFMLNNFPEGSYWGIDTNYSISTPNGSTPVELAVFVHGDAGGQLAGSTLEAQETDNGCAESQGGQFACSPDSICVDERCWTDGDGNPAHSVDFGDGPDECVVAAHQISRPVYLEVVDNGINDFDLDMTYSLTVTVSCGCPANCDNGLDFCQNGL